MKKDLRKAALSALDAGFSVFPIRDPWTKDAKGETIKRVEYQWAPLQVERMTESQAEREFALVYGLAIVCGAISDGLWVIDFDEPELFESYLDLALASVPFTPCVVKTQGGGYHLYFRSSDGAAPKNEKLAMSEDGRRVRIETRGEGGIVFAPPTPGYEGRLSAVPVVTPEQIDMLRAIARSFDLRPAPRAYNPPVHERKGERPGDLYNEATDWESVLRPLGWKLERSRGQVAYWTRPGKSEGVSASTGHNGKDELHVFSSSVPGLEPGRNYDRFEVYALCECGGDFAKAARKVIERYGAPALPTGRVAAAGIIDWSDAKVDPPARGAITVEERTVTERLYGQTDVGNADRLFDAHGERLRWVSDEQRWIVWDGRKWVRDSNGQTVSSLFIEIARDLEADPETRAWGQKCQSRGRVANAVEVLKSLPGMAVSADELDTDPYLLNTWSGVVDLRDGVLMPHSPTRLMTRICNAAYLDGADIEAVCPQFKAFLGDVTQNDFPMADAMLRYFGYCLTGLTREEKWMVGVGRGANGKTTLAKILMHCMGTYAAHMPPSIIQSSNIDRSAQELPMLSGVRLAIIEEPNTKTPLDRERVKLLVTGGKIPINPKYEIPRVMQWIGKMFLLANDRPKVDFDYAFSRRTMVLPFDLQLADSDRDQGLETKLISEADGILTLLVNAAMDYFEEGLTSCARMDDALKSYQDDSSVVDQFVAECVIEAPGSWVHPSDIYARYQAFAQKMGERAMPLANLKNQLKFRGFKTQERGKRKLWCYVDVTLTESEGYGSEEE